VKRLVLVPLAVTLVAALVPAAALAKGASEAEIAGPGIDEPISLTVQPGGEQRWQLLQLAEAAGFYPAVFVRSPDPMLDERPAGDLGPRYTITYVMPGPYGEDHLVQDVYPYAEPDPVTYVAPGQPFFGTERTRGGWYVSTTALKDNLVAAGLPRTPPEGGDGPGFPWTLAGALSALVVALAIGALAAVRIRHDRQTRTVTA